MLYDDKTCSTGMYRDGEEGHIGVRIRGDMEFNNRRNVFAHNESLKLSSAISLSTIVTYPFLIIALSKLFPRVFSASTSEMAAVDWPAAILDSQCRWTLGESLTHSQSDDRRGLNLDNEGLVSD